MRKNTIYKIGKQMWLKDVFNIKFSHWKYIHLTQKKTKFVFIIIIIISNSNSSIVIII